jgi:hypothetical protein
MRCRSCGYDPALHALLALLAQAGHAQGQDVFSRQIAVPPLPTKARYVAGATADLPSGVPPADEAALAGLEYSDRQRLMKERSEAAGIDRGHAKVCSGCFGTGVRPGFAAASTSPSAEVWHGQAQTVLRVRPSSMPQP